MAPCDSQFLRAAIQCDNCWFNGAIKSLIGASVPIFRLAFFIVSTVKTARRVNGFEGEKS
jgi:hypothetical protein